jgi:hypothetical protein
MRGGSIYFLAKMSRNIRINAQMKLEFQPVSLISCHPADDSSVLVYKGRPDDIIHKRTNKEGLIYRQGHLKR